MYKRQILLHIQKAKSGKKYQLRPMPALDAIDEAIGRAVEMGRAVHYTPGVGNLTTRGAPTMFATLDILAYIAEKSARMDVDFVATTGAGDVQTISEEIVRHAYSDVYKRQVLMFHPENENGPAYYLSLIHI